MILISGCLVGMNCKFDGDNNEIEDLSIMFENGGMIPICPEQMGGLSTPRKPAEIIYIDGKRHVVCKDGTDVTAQYEKGAQEVVDLALRLGITKAILKSRSPSCGKGKIYDGSFSHHLVDGNGILTDMLIQAGIEVIDSDRFIEKKKGKKNGK